MYKPDVILQDSESDRQAWLDARLDNVNSTESPALFNLSPYSSAYQLWNDKKTRQSVSFTDSMRTKAGRALEPSIAQLALDELECVGEPFKQYLKRPDCRLASSFDWIITSGDFEGWLLEIKNVDFLVFRDKWTVLDNNKQVVDECPHHIEIQANHQLAVTQAPGVIVAVLVAGNDLKFMFRDYDQEMTDMIIAKTNEFWQSIDENVEPDPVFEIDADYLINRYKDGQGEPFLATSADYIANLVDEDDALKAASSKIDKRRSEIKAECYTLIDNASAVIIDGQKRRSCTTTKENPGTTITAEHIGQIFNARKSFRQWR